MSGRTRYRWAVLAAGTAAQAGYSSIQFGIAVMLPALRLEFGLSLAEAGVVVAAATGGAMLSLLAWGVAADRVGERLVATVGLTGAAAALAVAGASSSYATLVSALACAGFAGASVNYRLVPSVRYPAPVPRRDWTPSTSLPNTSPTPAGCQPGPERQPAANGLTGEPGWLTLRNHMLFWPALAPIRSLSCSQRLPCRPSSINRCGDRGTCELASWMAVSTPAGPTLTA